MQLQSCPPIQFLIAYADPEVEASHPFLAAKRAARAVESEHQIHGYLAIKQCSGEDKTRAEQ